MKIIGHHLLHAAGLVSLLCFAGSNNVQAQSKATASAVTDTFVAVVPVRLLDDIKKSTDVVKNLRAQAKTRLERAQGEVDALESAITTKQKDLDALEGRMDTLDSDKSANEIARIKGKIALLEKLKDLLEVRNKARKAEVESAQAASAYADAQEEFYDLEAKLATKRNERAALAKKSSAANDLAAMDQAITELEGNALEGWEKALKKHDDSVSAEQDLVSRLKKLAEAQAEFHTP
jgi:chromosome segregation ATPase